MSLTALLAFMLAYTVMALAPGPVILLVVSYTLHEASPVKGVKGHSAELILRCRGLATSDRGLLVHATLHPVGLRISRTTILLAQAEARGAGPFLYDGHQVPWIRSITRDPSSAQRH